MHLFYLRRAACTRFLAIVRDKFHPGTTHFLLILPFLLALQAAWMILIISDTHSSLDLPSSQASWVMHSNLSERTSRNFNRSKSLTLILLDGSGSGDEVETTKESLLCSVPVVSSDTSHSTAEQEFRSLPNVRSIQLSPLAELNVGSQSGMFKIVKVLFCFPVHSCYYIFLFILKNP